jgi:hypothetical protein
LTPTVTPTARPSSTPTRAPAVESDEEENDNEPESNNQLGAADFRTEGNVMMVSCPIPPSAQADRTASDCSVFIATADGIQEVVMQYDARSVGQRARVGDYLEADGVKEHELLFYAESAVLWRDGEKVR